MFTFVATITLVALSALMFVIFPVEWESKYGPLSSISEGYYRLKEVGKSWQFTIGLALFTIPLFIIAGYYDFWLLVLSNFFIFMVAVLPKYREKIEGFLHVTFATLSIIALLLSMWFELDLIILCLVTITVLGAIKLFIKEDSTRLLEYIVYICGCISIITFAFVKLLS
jgi:hypothetical protein